MGFPEHFPPKFYDVIFCFKVILKPFNSNYSKDNMSIRPLFIHSSVLNKENFSSRGKITCSIFKATIFMVYTKHTK